MANENAENTGGEAPEINSSSPPEKETKKRRHTLAGRIWRIALKTVLILLAVVVLVVFGVYFWLSTPSGKRFLTNKVVEIAHEQLGVEVKMGELDVRFPGRVRITGLEVSDHRNKLMLKVPFLKASLGFFNTITGNLSLNNVELNDAYLNLHRYKGDTASNLGLIINKLTAGPSDTTTSTKSSAILFSSVRLKNFTFNWYDEESPLLPPNMVDFNHVGITNMNANITSVRIDGGDITGNIKDLALRDRSGFVLNHLRGYAAMSDTSLELSNMYLETPYTVLQNRLRFQYRDISNMSYFTDSVTIALDLVNSVASLRDLNFFADALQNKKDSFVFRSATVRGKVSSLRIRDLDLYFGALSHVEGNVELQGLPNIEETFMSMRFKDVYTNGREVERMFPEAGPMPPEVRRMGNIKVRGNFTGFINDFVAYAKIESDVGEVNSDINLKMADRPEQSVYKGRLQTKAFNLGKLLANDQLGLVTINKATVDGKGFTVESMKAQADAVIERFDFNKYPYANIKINGGANARLFNGTLSIDDPNAKLNFNGKMDYNSKDPVLDFKAVINLVNFKKLNLSDEDYGLATRIDINTVGLDPDRITGRMIATGTRVRQGNKNYNLDTILFTSRVNGQFRDMRLESKLVDARAYGNFKITELPDFFATLANQYVDPAFVKLKGKPVRQNLTVDIEVGNLEPVYGLIPIKLYVEPGSYLKAKLATNGDTIKLDGSFPHLQVMEYQVNHLTLDADSTNVQNDLIARLKVDSLFQKDTLLAKNILVATTLNKEFLTFHTYAEDNTSLRSADVRGKFRVVNQDAIVSLDSSYIKLDTIPFVLTAEPVTITKNTKVIFPNVTLSKGDQVLRASGSYSSTENTPILVELDNINIHEGAAFVPALQSMSGLLNGQITVENLAKTPEVDAALSINDLKYEQTRLGTMTINSRYDDAKQQVQVDAKLRADSFKTTLDAKATVGLDARQTLSADIKMDRTNLALFEPFLEGVLTKASGFISADMKIRGTTANPKITGSLDLIQDTIALTMLEAPYVINHHLEFDGKFIDLNDMVLTDMRGQKGVINGRVDMRDLASPRLNLSLKMNDFTVLDADPQINSPFYGTVHVTGNTTIRGPVDNLVINVDVKTEDNSTFSLPIADANSFDSYDFIKFVGREDFGKTENKVEVTGITINMKLKVTPGLLTQIIFDPRVGDIIEVRGNGDLAVNMNAAGDLTMSGTYVVDDGNYTFTAFDIVSKDFNIDQGSTIKWAGDPLDANLNVTATYTVTNVSLLPLMAAQSNEPNSQKNAPVATVDTKLRMRGSLSEPDIYLDFEVRQMQGLASSFSDIDAALNRIRQDEAERNKNAISLLVLNTFAPSDLAASAAGSTLGSGLGSLVSNQLNYWLGQMSNNVQLGVDINGANSDFILKLNTTLLGGKVNFSGSYDVSTLNRNVTFDIPLNDRYRATLFNRTAPTAIPLQNNTMTGIGFSFRKQFDKWNEVLMRQKGRERQAARRAEKQKMRDKMLQDQSPKEDREEIERIKRQEEKKQQEDHNKGINTHPANDDKKSPADSSDNKKK